jgi:hypothetical protein
VARLGSIGVVAISDMAVAEDAVLSAAPGASRAPGASTAPGTSTSSPAVLRIVAREDLIVAREAARVVGVVV